MLRGKSIEEIVNRWSSDLETHVRQFTKHASEIAVWDRALIENGNNVRYTRSPSHPNMLTSHTDRRIVQSRPGV